MKNFSGIIPPVATPLTPTGELDLPSLDRLTDFLIDNGMDGLFVLGSTGEVAYLTDSQRDVVVRQVAARTAGRVPVIAGAIDLTAARVTDQARRYLDLGADAIVTTAPIYARNDTAEIADHFRAVKRGIGDAPLFAYDIPIRIGTKLSLDLVMTLAAEGVLAGIKDSSGDDVGFRRLVAANRAAGSPLSVLSGHEVVLDGMFLLGADGAVPGYANVDPAGYRDLWTLSQAGDWVAARDLQDRLAADFEIVFQAANRSGDASGVGAFKCAMAARGIIDSAAMAAPVIALDGEVATAISTMTTVGTKP